MGDRHGQHEYTGGGSLTDTACVILAEGAVLDDAARKKALDQEITVLSTDMPVFEAALKIHGMLS